MSKFNKRSARPAATSPVRTVPGASTPTHEGGQGYLRDAKSELFILAVSQMSGEDTFYESGAARDARLAALVHTVAGSDPEWLAAFLPWLRDEANLRSAPVAAALEGARALLAAGQPGGRQLVASVLRRADEPGEALAYWTSRYGRAIPKPVKRGIADGLVKLYDERSLAKYDSEKAAFRFADVIELVHPTPKAPWQGELFTHALDRRHDRDNPVPGGLAMLRRRAELLSLPVGERRAKLTEPGFPERLAEAGLTWEALAGWLQGPMDAAAWTAILPSMGYMARLRNLRNFDEAGLSDEVADRIAAELADPARVAKSRQLPFRFYSAYKAAPSLRWGHALDKALAAATSNVPAFTGRTLVLVDTSASMTSNSFSARSTVQPVQAAALFGVALAARGNEVDLHGFASGVFRHKLAHKVAQGGSVLAELEKFCARVGEVGHGTEIAASLRETYRKHDRVVVISDMQTNLDRVAETTKSVPAHVPLYGFNIGGYRAAAMPTGTGNRHEIGGLSDATFRMIPLLEAGHQAAWPWL